MKSLWALTWALLGLWALVIFGGLRILNGHHTGAASQLSGWSFVLTGIAFAGVLLAAVYTSDD